MKRIFFGILVLTLVGLWIRPSMAQTITLRLGHVGFPGSLFAITTDEYAKRVNAALKAKWRSRFSTQASSAATSR